MTRDFPVYTYSVMRLRCGLFLKLDPRYPAHKHVLNRTGLPYLMPYRSKFIAFPHHLNHRTSVCRCAMRKDISRTHPFFMAGLIIFRQRAMLPFNSLVPTLLYLVILHWGDPLTHVLFSGRVNYRAAAAAY